MRPSCLTQAAPRSHVEPRPEGGTPTAARRETPAREVGTAARTGRMTHAAGPADSRCRQFVSSDRRLSSYARRGRCNRSLRPPADPRREDVWNRDAGQRVADPAACRWAQHGLLRGACGPRAVVMLVETEDSSGTPDRRVAPGTGGSARVGLPTRAAANRAADGEVRSGYGVTSSELDCPASESQRGFT